MLWPLEQCLECRICSGEFADIRTLKVNVTAEAGWSTQAQRRRGGAGAADGSKDYKYLI